MQNIFSWIWLTLCFKQRSRAVEWPDEAHKPDDTLATGLESKDEGPSPRLAHSSTPAPLTARPISSPLDSTRLRKMTRDFVKEEKNVSRCRTWVHPWWGPQKTRYWTLYISVPNLQTTAWRMPLFFSFLEDRNRWNLHFISRNFIHGVQTILWWQTAQTCESYVFWNENTGRRQSAETTETEPYKVVIIK